MGIPFLYGEWIKAYGGRNSKILRKDLPEYVSSLSIDMNALIHLVAQLVYSYGDYKNDSRLEEILEISDERLNKEIYSGVIYFI